MDQRTFPRADPVMHEHVIMRPEGEWLSEPGTCDRSLATQRRHDPYAPFPDCMSWHAERKGEQRECSDGTPGVQCILLQFDRTMTGASPAV
jgi:hypothetical protein